MLQTVKRKQAAQAVRVQQKAVQDRLLYFDPLPYICLGDWRLAVFDKHVIQRLTQKVLTLQA